MIKEGIAAVVVLVSVFLLGMLAGSNIIVEKNANDRAIEACIVNGGVPLLSSYGENSITDCKFPDDTTRRFH